MAKIEKVIIENFRAYEGTHDFSFLTPKGLANLVVVYAPNGYGKTSFFDAVEWAFSNKIRRFENGVLKQELESKDFASGDQIILTNRSAYAKGGTGQITISTDENKIIRRTVVPRQINNTDIKNDYRDVPLHGDYNQLEINKFSDYNMLTQDQIDSFLRFKSPEEKFEALKEFWPEGSEASTAFSTLTTYSKVLIAKAADIQHKINNYSAQIEQNINSDANFSKINNWITEFNAEKLTNIIFPSISKDINDEVYRGIIQSNETYKLIVAGEATNAGNMSIRFDALTLLHTSYLDHVSALESAEKSLSQQKTLLANLEKIRVLQETNANSSTTLKKLLIEKADWERVIFLFPEFTIDKSQLQSLQSATHGFYEEIEEKTELKNLVDEEIADIAIERANALSNLEQEREIASKIEVNLRQIEKLRKDILDGLDHQQYSEFCIADTVAKTAHIYQDRDFIKEILNNNNFSGYKTVDFEVNFYIDLLGNRTQKHQDIVEQLRLLEVEMETKGSFNENLSRLVKWATNQVSSQHISSCPMCNTAFNDVDDLLRAINSEKGDILMMSDLEKNIEEYSLIRSYLQEEVMEAESYLLTFFQNRLSDLNHSIEISELTIDQLESIIRRAQDSIDHAEIVIDQIFGQITPNTEFLDYSSTDLNEIRINNYQNITNLTAFIKEQDEILTRKNNDLKTLNNGLIVLRNSVSNNANRTNLILAKETYIECSELLNKLYVDQDQLNTGYLEEQLLERSVAIGLENSIIGRNKQTIGEIEGEFKENGNLLNEAELKESLAETERQHNNFRQEKINFESSYSALIKDGDFTLGSIQNQYELFHNKELELLKLKERLDAFGIDLAIIETDVVRNGLQKELIALKKDQTKVEIALNRIEKSKTTVGDFITKGIDDYFNKDVINQIYSKIEPHPKLTEIDIRADSTGRQPRLTIRAKNDSEELAPGLFLSTGQVNVLSLSIFIARAYEMGNSHFDCILMDDPVQNMSDINVLSFVDLLRILIMDQDKQVMISTHDEKFFRLLKNKLSPGYFKSKFIELGSYGKLKQDLIN
jgi:exonuclease SbcC